MTEDSKGSRALYFTARISFFFMFFFFYFSHLGKIVFFLFFLYTPVSLSQKLHHLGKKIVHFFKFGNRVFFFLTRKSEYIFSLKDHTF